MSSTKNIRNPSELARALACRARLLRGLVLKQLEHEGPLYDLYDTFRIALNHDQKVDEFADAFAQTITYGLLTARWLSKDGLATTGKPFTRQSALAYLPVATPLLNNLFNFGLSFNLDEQPSRLFLAVDDLADVLDHVDIKLVFGTGAKDSFDLATDPVTHFYEPFLAAYDSGLKIRRGVFFTPRPVVSFIVRSVHETLQREFGLEDGLASIDTWGDVAKRTPGFRIPEGTRPSDAFVRVLDPAIGTGTFIDECIGIIETTMKDRWCRELKIDSWSNEKILTRWNEYVSKHLLPRLYGFELMITAYAICHLNLSYKIRQTGFRFGRNDAIHVGLTNALEPPNATDADWPGHFVAVADEIREVSEIKRSTRFTVVIGNPPYSERSSNRGAWIDDLMQRYKRTIRQEPQYKAVSNDYVKFLRLAEHITQQSGRAVLGMITGNSYLDGLLFRDLRAAWLHGFCSIHVLNLHGSKRRSASRTNDENVFDIMQGVAIIIATTKGFQRTQGACEVSYASLVGSCLGKHNALLGSITAIPRCTFRPAPPLFSFCPSTPSAETVALDTWLLADLFGTGSPKVDRNVAYSGGFKTCQDSFTVGFNEAELKTRIDELANSELSEATLRARYRLCSTAHFNFSRAREAAQNGTLNSAIRWLRYRPFDDRPMIWAREVLCEPRIGITKHLLRPNLCLVATRVVKDEAFAHVSVSRGPVEVISLSSSTSTNAYMFPLYRYFSEPLQSGVSHRVVNLAPRFLAHLAATIGRVWKETGNNATDASVFGPEDVLAYIYALLHAGSYRRWFGDALLKDFPPVPMPCNGAVFTSLIVPGHSLLSLHLMEKEPGHGVGELVSTGSPTVEQVVREGDMVWLDKKRTSGFRGIPDPVWVYQVGSYQVLKKWLNSRRGRVLTIADVDHFRRVAGVLHESVHLIDSIEVAIKAGGGWPGAFATKA